MQLYLQFLLGNAISQAISRSTCNQMAITTSRMQLKLNHYVDSVLQATYDLDGIR